MSVYVKNDSTRAGTCEDINGKTQFDTTGFAVVELDCHNAIGDQVKVIGRTNDEVRV